MGIYSKTGRKPARMAENEGEGKENQRSKNDFFRRAEFS